MADFKLSAEIAMQAEQALREIDKVVRATKNTKKEFNLLGKVVTLDTQRIAEGLKKITAIAGVMFAAIAIASPSMRVAFKQMEIAALEMSIALGEQLAPILEGSVVPAMTNLRNVILNLNPEQQAMIGLTIALVLVLGTLAIILAAITVEFLIVAAVVVALAIVIAALIIYWDDITAAIVTFISKIPGIENFVASIIDLKDAVLRFWEVAEPIFRVLFIGLLVAVSPFIVGMSLAIAGLVASIMLIIPAITLVINIFTALLNAVSGIMETIKLLIKGDFDEAWGHIKETFNTLIKDILTAFKTFANSFLDVIKDVIIGLLGVFNAMIKLVNKIPGVDIPLISVPTFQEGGTVERTGLIFAHRGEEIVRGTEARQFREDRGGAVSGRTIIQKNTFIIKAVNPKAIAKEIMTMQKISANRRANI